MLNALFKARRLDNGKWVEGWFYPYRYLGNNTICYIVEYPLSKRLGVTEHRVDLGTLCQYTGTNDRNGTKIFIGDILEVDAKRYIITKVRNGWRLNLLKSNGEIGANVTTEHMNAYTVIGNRHDENAYELRIGSART